MTKIEWQRLCRIAKSEGRYLELRRLIEKDVYEPFIFLYIDDEHCYVRMHTIQEYINRISYKRLLKKYDTIRMAEIMP